MALEDLSGQLQGKFGGNLGNRLLGTNAGTIQKFSLPGVIVNALRSEFLTLDKANQNVNGPQIDRDKDGNPVYQNPNMVSNMSMLGTAVLDYLEFPVRAYPDINDPTSSRTYRGIRIDEVIFSVSRDKKIVETMTVGSQQSIKEYIAAGDYRITAQCVIIGNTTDDGTYQDFTASFVDPKFNNNSNNNTDVSVSGQYRKEGIGNAFPYGDMKALHDMLTVPAAIKVNSRLLNDIFSIENVVVLNYEFSQDRGANNYQLLTIEMVSDESPEKQSKDETNNEGNI